MIANYFSYDGISSEVYNIIIGSFSGSDDGTQEMGNVDITTVKAPHSNNFLKANATYNNPIMISFSIMKLDCANPNDYVFTPREIGFISRWLARKDYKELKFRTDGKYPEGTHESDKWEDIHYNAIMKVNQHMVGGECVGFDITATCDAPWGYDNKQTTTIDASSGSATALIHDDSDEIGDLLPRVEIEVLEAGNIEITNNFTGKKTKIRNCVAGEKIVIEKMVITSTECRPVYDRDVYDYDGRHRTLFDDFNWEWPTISNYFTPNNTRDSRVNKYVVSGNCRIRMIWESPRKAVV